jgi:hydroxymethylpyrimidine/phosphomethylpyrimidine kinase
LCSTVIVKCGNEKKTLCKNRLYEFNDENTWTDVLHDVLDEDFTFHKTDTFSACISDKLTGTTTLSPDMEESIRVVKDFDKTSKYVTFTIHRNVDVGLANPQTRRQMMRVHRVESQRLQ